MNCSIGTYSPLGLQCIDCFAGYYTDGKMNGASECLGCVAGTFSMINSMSCSECPKGKWSSERASNCTKCDAGKKSAVGGSSSCTSCDAGYFQQQAGSTECNPCPAGWYTSSTGRSQCDSCEEGKYSDSSASTSCDSCPAGYFQNGTGSTICSPCSVGKYSSSTGMKMCSDCVAGKYSSTPSSLSCAQCESKWFSTDGAGNCTICIEGYYLDVHNHCMECPDGGECSQGTTLATITVEDGYYRFSSTSSEVYPCGDGHCKETSLTGDAICSDEKSMGPLCSYCEEGFYMDTLDHVCQKCACNSEQIVNLLLVLCATVFLALGIHRYWNMFSKTLAHVKNNSVGMVGSTPFTLLWFMIQATVQFTSKYSVEYPTPFAELLKIFDFISLDIFLWVPTGCFNISFLAELLLQTCWWPMFALICCALAQICDRFHLQHIKWRLFAWSSHLLLLFHAQICSFVFSTFDCTQNYDVQNSDYDLAQQDDGIDRYIVTDMSLSCRYEDEHYKNLFSIAVTFVAFYTVVIPAAFAFILSNRHQYKYIAKPILFMVREVKPDVWFFEVFALVFRFILTGYLSIFPNESFRLCFALLLTVSMVAFTGIVQPYLHDSHNQLAVLTYGTLTFVVIFTLALHTNLVTESDESGFAMFMLLVYVAICVITSLNIVNAPMKSLVRAIEQRTPLPGNFATMWATHQDKLATHLLSVLEITLFESVNQYTDEKTAAKSWADLTSNVLALTNSEGTLIWNESVPSSDVLNHQCFTLWIEMKASSASESPVTLTKFKQTCTELFGFFNLDEGWEVEYDRIFKTALNSALTKISIATIENIEMIDTSCPLHGKCESDDFLPADSLLHAINLVRAKFLEKTLTGAVPDVPRFTLVKCVAQAASLKYEKQCQAIVADVLRDGGIGNVKPLDGPWLKQAGVERLTRPFEEFMPKHMSPEVKSNFCGLVDKLVFPELLRSMGFILLDEFNGALLDIAGNAGLDPTSLHVARVKGVDRMRVTVSKYRDYKDAWHLTWPFSSYFGDVLRCSLACPSGRAMLHAWEQIKSHPKIKVLQVMNKAACGRVPYNIHVSASFESDQLDFPFIVEIQILHEWIYSMKDRSHRLYEITRAPTASDI